MKQTQIDFVEPFEKSNIGRLRNPSLAHLAAAEPVEFQQR
jgi:hypothetical protein